VDLIEVERLRDAIELHGKRFLNRIYTEKEIAENFGKIESLAGRFAAKEAAAKALGCGIGDVSWKEIEILRGDSGEPILVLHGAAEKKSKDLGLARWSVSVSHTRLQAVALVVGVG
jgi:holo-[acyl-carrier protein] synthase